MLCDDLIGLSKKLRLLVLSKCTLSIPEVWEHTVKSKEVYNADGSAPITPHWKVL